MKKISALILFSMLTLTAACSHEPTMSDEFSDLQLDNSSGKVGAAPTSEMVDSAPMDLDLTPPADPAPLRSTPRHARHAKKHSKASKKKLAKSKKHSRKDSELARSR